MVIKGDKSILVTLYVICLFGLGDFQGNHLNQGLKCDKISLFIESIFGLLDVYKDLWPWQSSLIAVAPGNCLRSSSLFGGQFTSSGPVTISVSRWTCTCISCTVRSSIFLLAFTLLPHYCSRSLLICLSPSVKSFPDITTSTTFPSPMSSPPRKPTESTDLGFRQSTTLCEAPASMEPQQYIIKTIFTLSWLPSIFPNYTHRRHSVWLLYKLST